MEKQQSGSMGKGVVSEEVGRERGESLGIVVGEMGGEGTYWGPCVHVWGSLITHQTLPPLDTDLFVGLVLKTPALIR